MRQNIQQSENDLKQGLKIVFLDHLVLSLGAEISCLFQFCFEHGSVKITYSPGHRTYIEFTKDIHTS